MELAEAMTPGIEEVDRIDYDKLEDLGPIRPFEVVREKSVLRGSDWIPKSVLQIFNGRLWVATWFAKQEGIEQ